MGDDKCRKAFENWAMGERGMQWVGFQGTGIWRGYASEEWEKAWNDWEDAWNAAKDTD